MFNNVNQCRLRCLPSFQIKETGAMSKVISVEKEKTNVSQLNRSNRSINLNLHTQNCTGKEKIVASLSCQFTSISGIAAH